MTRWYLYCTSGGRFYIKTAVVKLVHCIVRGCFFWLLPSFWSITHCGLLTRVNQLVIVGSGNGLVPFGTLPLPDPKFNHYHGHLWKHQWNLNSSYKNFLSRKGLPWPRFVFHSSLKVLNAGHKLMLVVIMWCSCAFFVYTCVYILQNFMSTCYNCVTYV